MKYTLTKELAMVEVITKENQPPKLRFHYSVKGIATHKANQLSVNEGLFTEVEITNSILIQAESNIDTQISTKYPND